MIGRNTRSSLWLFHLVVVHQLSSILQGPVVKIWSLASPGVLPGAGQMLAGFTRPCTGEVIWVRNVGCTFLTASPRRYLKDALCLKFVAVPAPSEA